MPGDNRLLIIVFDALRPDMVSADLMPNLTAFCDAGVRFTASRAVFPTETRVNQSALITGCNPGQHGIVGNKFVELTASPDRLFNTGDEDQLRLGDERLNGKLFGVPSLGELLDQQGKSLATLSAGTPGGGRILNHRAEEHGTFRLAMHRPDAACPAGIADTIAAKIGPIPPHKIPSLDWLTWATDAWLDFVEPEVRPDVGILWFCEPDNSYHYSGIGSPDNLAAIRHADVQLGRILDSLKSASELQLMVLSDHGQIEVSGEPLDLAQQLAEAGFSVGEVPGPTTQLALALDSAGGIFVHDRDSILTRRVAEWLLAQPWCGLVSVDGDKHTIGGTVDHATLGIAGSRAPDIGLVFRISNANGPWGWPGSTLHDAPYPPGGGTHGGLHPAELNNWLSMAGSSFAKQRTITTPAGIVDILPTALAVLDLPIPNHLAGRILSEALVDSELGQPINPQTRIPAGELELGVSQVGETRYLDGLFPKD